MTRILFIVDGSLDRPILHSQGIPHLKRLVKLGHHCYILSFEENRAITESPLAKDLKESGVSWQPVFNHNNRIGVIFEGFLRAFQLCRHEKIEIVHCRSYRPAMIGSILKIVLRCGFLFDMRGFLIDEQIMLGRWQTGSLKYRIARFFEKWMILNSDEIVTNTKIFREMVLNLPYFPRAVRASQVIIIPNCVDLHRFQCDPVAREKVREDLGWANQYVMIFIGEARKWEDFNQIIMFFTEFKRFEKNAFLAWIVYGDIDFIKSLPEIKSLGTEDFYFGTARPEQIPDILNAADLGLLFRKDNKYICQVSSPIKFAEYLACGLPVVINSDIGDTKEIIQKYKVGQAIDPQIPGQLREGVQQILDLCQSDPYLRQHCREAAENDLSLDLAVELYSKSYERIAEDRLTRTKQ